jgi:Holliday junction DNA helicase RuvA
MIAHLRGKLRYKSLDYVVIDVNGLGYQVFIPLSTFYRLPDVDQQTSLNIYTHVSENALQLYGFFSSKEKELFELLISVSGVGPRLAKNILSGTSVDELSDALLHGDSARLNRIPGVGVKTSQRLIVELRDKAAKLYVDLPRKEGGDEKRETIDDVTSALNNLGYKISEAERAVKRIDEKIRNESDFETIFKEALKILTR